MAKIEKYLIKKMDSVTAEEILKWNYLKDFEFYNFKYNKENLNKLIKGLYFSVRDKNNDLMGYYYFGEAAKIIQGYKKGAYDDPICTDIGVALNPSYCGKGSGLNFLISGMNFAKNNYYADYLRCTLPLTNKIAINTCKKAGFKIGKVFDSTIQNKKMEFIILTVRI